MGKQNTRTYADHWGSYYDGSEHSGPRPRWPWLRDAIIAMVVGCFLGGSIGFRIADGSWPNAVTIAAPALVFHTLIVGFGQLSDETRLGPADLLRISAFGITATVVVAVTTFFLMS